MNTSPRDHILFLLTLAVIISGALARAILLGTPDEVFRIVGLLRHRVRERFGGYPDLPNVQPAPSRSVWHELPPPTRE